jgi:hypothetical protein
MRIPPWRAISISTRRDGHIKDHLIPVCPQCLARYHHNLSENFHPGIAPGLNYPI